MWKELQSLVNLYWEVPGVCRGLYSKIAGLRNRIINLSKGDL